ncbi:MAG: prepilin-type N-terminal cleavage/methylation domain-containing protein [Candidatus Moranbacteria bacterium]|nr:prepilin-type N-terminal cleavage/methylation domain-containing protein [Candidatus Moranbacteria bacterium]
MNGKNRKTLKGFTLVEMVVSVGIFAVMSTVIAGTFASGFSSYRSSRELQRDVESSQFAINTMAKHLRTSSVVTPSSASMGATDIIFYDYSSGRCFEYDFQGGILEARWRDATDPTDSEASLAECNSGFLNGRTSNRLTSGYVDGRFFVIPSSAVSGSEQVGRIATYVTVKESSTKTKTAQVQTTVSLRDYDNAGY